MLSAWRVASVVHEEDVLSSPYLAEAHVEFVICALFNLAKIFCYCSNHPALCPAVSRHMQNSWGLSNVTSLAVL